MSARPSFAEYVRGPLRDSGGFKYPGSQTDLGIDERLLRADYIDTRSKLLIWAEERWPSYFKSRRTPDNCLEIYMKRLWAAYLAWTECEE